jgi:hypothetical protein
MLVSIADLKTYMDISLTARQEDACEMILLGLQSEMEAYLGRPVEQEEHTEEHVIPSYFQGVPATSFFYDNSLDTTGDTMNYIQPSQVISLRNSPVASVKSVSIRNLSSSATYLGEALQRDAVITNATVSGEFATYFAVNDFRVGQWVDVRDVTPSTLNVAFAQITDANASSFTLKKPGITGTYASGGSAKATGNDYTVHRYGIELYRGFPNDVVTVVYTGGLDGNQIKMLKLMILRAATREMQNMHDETVGMKDLTTRNVAPLETGFLEKELNAIKSYRRRRIA